MKLEVNDFSKQRRVLLVEDSKLIQHITIHLLMDFNCKTHIASNGVEAIKKFSTIFDLVLLDYSLPDITGDELCKLFKKKIPKHKVPVVAVTSEGENLRSHCLEVGMQDFFSKPLMKSDVKMIYEKFLDENKNVNGGSRQISR